MPAPAVQTLQDILGQIQAAYKPQQDLLDSQVASNDVSGQAQVQGIDAQKTQAFGDITQQGNNRGMFFSGFAPDQQAKYTAGTYLPALAELQGKIADVRSNLLGKKADIETQGNTQALTVQQQQQRDYNDYVAKQEEIARQEAEAERQRAFEASQNAAARSASGAAKSAGGITAAQSFSAGLAKVTGKDGYVGPGDYTKFKNQWVASGAGNGTEFDAAMAGFRNPKNKAYKIG